MTTLNPLCIIVGATTIVLLTRFLLSRRNNLFCLVLASPLLSWLLIDAPSHNIEEPISLALALSPTALDLFDTMSLSKPILPASFYKPSRFPREKDDPKQFFISLYKWGISKGKNRVDIKMVRVRPCLLDCFCLLPLTTLYSPRRTWKRPIMTWKPMVLQPLTITRPTL